MKRLATLAALALLWIATATAGTIFNGNFSGSYDPSHWTFSNSVGGDGFMVLTGAPGSVVVLGADNDASGNLALYEFALAPATGTVDVYWYWETFDGPVYDPGVYYVNGSRTTIIDTSSGAPNSQWGYLSFSVNAGDSFSFGIDSTDGCCGRGALQISDTQLTHLIPEPGTSLLLGGGMLAVGFARRRWFRR